MITTISKQGGRRYPQIGSTGQPWAGWIPSVGETTPPAPVVLIDTHDGGERKRIQRYREEQEERKQDVIKAFQRVFGIEIPEETPAVEVAQAVEAKIIKPKRSREREVLQMARGLKSMLEDGERIAMEMRREAEEEEFIVQTILGVLH